MDVDNLEAAFFHCSHCINLLAQLFSFVLVSDLLGWWDTDMSRLNLVPVSYICNTEFICKIHQLVKTIVAAHLDNLPGLCSDVNKTCSIDSLTSCLNEYQTRFGCI